MRIPGNQYLDAPNAWVPEHGYVLKLSAKRFEVLESDLQSESGCSQGVPKIPVAMRRRWMLCFLSVRRGYLTHIARSVIRYAAESGKDRLDIWNVQELARPVRIAAIYTALSGKQAWRAKKALDGGHISPSAFELILAALRQLDDAAFDAVTSLIDSQAPDLDVPPSAAESVGHINATLLSLR